MKKTKLIFNFSNLVFDKYYNVEDAIVNTYILPILKRTLLLDNSRYDSILLNGGKELVSLEKQIENLDTIILTHLRKEFLSVFFHNYINSLNQREFTEHKNDESYRMTFYIDCNNGLHLPLYSSNNFLTSSYNSNIVELFLPLKLKDSSLIYGHNIYSSNLSIELLFKSFFTNIAFIEFNTSDNNSYWCFNILYINNNTLKDIDKASDFVKKFYLTPDYFGNCNSMNDAIVELNYYNHTNLKRVIEVTKKGVIFFE